MLDFIKVDKERIQEFIKELLSNNVVNPLSLKLESILKQIENSVDNKKVIEDLQRDKSDLISKNENLKNLLETKEENINNLTEELKTTKNNLNNSENEKTKKDQELTSLNNKLEKIKSEKESKEQEIQKLEKIITAKDIEIDKAIYRANENETLLSQYKEISTGNIEKIESEKSQLKNEIKEKNTEIEKYQNEISEKSQKIENLKLLNKQQSDSIIDLEKIKKDNESKIKKTDDDLHKSEQKYKKDTSSLNDEILKLKESIKDLEHIKAFLTEQSNEYLSKVNNYTDIVITPYKKLYEKILNCKSLTKFRDEQKLTDNVTEISNYEKIIKLIGKEYYLAKEIQIAIEKEKNINPLALTPDESELYEELNGYYKASKGISFDVIYFPKTEKFDKSIMKDIKDQRGDYNKWIEIYIPAIQEKEGIILFKALVKGSK